MSAVQIFLLILGVAAMLAIIAVSIYFAVDSCQRGPAITKQISVVIPNFARPHNLPPLINALRNMPEIDDIIVTHGNPDTFIEFDGVTNVKNYELNAKYGAASRWFVFLHTKHSTVLSIDDDMIPSQKLIRKMYLELQKNPNQIVGPFSRTCNSDGYRDETRNYNIIITGLAMFPNKFVESFVQNFGRYAELLEKTKGNGEDILFNYHCISEIGVKPKKVDGSFTNLDRITGAYSERPGHYETRSEICQFIHGPQFP